VFRGLGAAPHGGGALSRLASRRPMRGVEGPCSPGQRSWGVGWRPMGRIAVAVVEATLDSRTSSGPLPAACCAQGMWLPFHYARQRPSDEGGGWAYPTAASGRQSNPPARFARLGSGIPRNPDVHSSGADFCAAAVARGHTRRDGRASQSRQARAVALRMRAWTPDRIRRL